MRKNDGLLLNSTDIHELSQSLAFTSYTLYINIDQIAVKYMDNFLSLMYY